VLLTSYLLRLLISRAPAIRDSCRDRGVRARCQAPQKVSGIPTCSWPPISCDSWSP